MSGFLTPIVVFGLSFELPLLLVMLNFGGVLSGKKMAGWWRGMILGITLFAAAYLGRGGFALAVVLHAVAGAILFTSGLGGFFYHGAIGR